MRRLVVGLAVTLLLSASPAFAQVQVGIGLGAPVSGRYIPLDGHIDSTGEVTIDRTLDSSPQLVVQVLRTFKLKEKLGVGPFLGFCPKVDFGTSSNTSAETPLGAGFGFLISTNAGAKQRINFGLMWLITPPMSQVNPAWRDGFQAPRTSQGIPQDIRLEKSSVSRIMLTMTVSGIF